MGNLINGGMEYEAKPTGATIGWKPCINPRTHGCKMGGITATKPDYPVLPDKIWNLYRLFWNDEWKPYVLQFQVRQNIVI